MVKKKQPVTVYGIYHSNWRGDIKKTYRYLRYALKTDLILLDHVDETGFLPAKYYRLTTAGEELMKWATTHILNIIKEVRPYL